MDNNIPNLNILVGPSCSGKSTLARKRADEGYYIVSRDNFREMLFGTYRMGTKEEEKLVSELVKGTVILTLSMGKSVTLDNTHLDLKYIKQALADYNDFADVFISFMSLVETKWLIERSNLRGATTGKYIPANVIEQQNKKYKELTDTYDLETFYPQGTYNNDTI